MTIFGYFGRLKRIRMHSDVLRRVRSDPNEHAHTLVRSIFAGDKKIETAMNGTLKWLVNGSLLYIYICYSPPGPTENDVTFISSPLQTFGIISKTWPHRGIRGPCAGDWWSQHMPGLVNVYIHNYSIWKITMLLMGKSTINGHFQ